ncbi:MAG: HAD hydrolase-like protein [Verrucomicrobiota bacterium]|nr:HAD hydrolase-like protein [Verrucomicrobiota bacterium]
MNSFKLILFDIDGTLIRTGGAGIRAFAETFEQEFGLQDATKEISFAGRTDTSLVREVLLKHQLDPTPEAIGRFFDSYPKWLVHFLKSLNGELCPGVMDSLESLQSHQSQPAIGLLTGNIQLGAQLKLGHFNLWDRFQFGGFADDSEDRNCIAAVARQRGEAFIQQRVANEQVLVIGDTPLDILCARSIGAKVLAVATGTHKLPELAASKPDFLAEDLLQFPISQLLSNGT